MKKYLYLVCLICVSVVLSGCGTKKLTCTKTSDESGTTTNEKIVINFKNNKPSTTSMEMDMKFSDDQKSYIDMSYSILESTFEEMEEDGVTVDTNKTDDSIKIKMDIDFSKVKDTDDLSIEFDEDDTLENIQKELKDEGYECK